MALPLVDFDERDHDFQAITSGRPFIGAPEVLDLAKRLIVVGFRTNGLNIHKATYRPDPHGFGRGSTVSRTDDGSCFDR